jgi:formate-dependent nitrite reductase membrane component NrfD
MSDAAQNTLGLEGETGRNGSRPETSHHTNEDAERQKKESGYYGIPPIKKPHWTWQVPLYLWLGGIGAGSHLIATLVRFTKDGDPALLRASRYTTLFTMILSPILLIWDLGRPERFLNMLRIIKLRSPMSTGSWSISIFGSLSGLIATQQAAEDGLLGDNFAARAAKRFIPDRALAIVTLPFGLYVGAYTGILLIATSVPMWAKNWMLMGPTFLSSGFSNALSAMTLILNLGNWGEERTHSMLRRAEKATIIIEAALIGGSLYKMGRWGSPLRSKRLAPTFFGGTVVGGILLPLALLFGVFGEESRNKSILTSILVLVGGLLFRFDMVLGGKMSADDPEATFSFAQPEDAKPQR